MSTPVIIPAPPRPPPEGFTQSYVQELNRWLTNMVATFSGIYHLRGGDLYLSPESLPTSGYNLKPGEVFANDGILTWVRADDIWAGGFTIEGEVGTLTVTT